ncbi:hypothetical protein CR513_41694, partial [Mucuna pruriens]
MSGTSSSETYSSSSSSGEALKAMPVVVAEGVSSPAPTPSESKVAPPKWVHKDVLENQSVMTRSEVESLVVEGKWVRSSHAHQLTVVRCGKKERVCYAAREGEDPFVYMYETMLLDLGVTLPFDFFEADVLRMLGIAPSQLHPNGLATIQAFKVVCLALGVLPTTFIFLSHYTTRVGQSVGWVSLTPLPNTGLFTSYTASYKGFKSRFVKIMAAEEGMLKKQGVDMAALIKKARLTNDARSSGRKASSAETAPTAAEKKSATSLAEKDSAPVVEKLTASAVSDKEAAKRKAGSETEEDTATNNGKATAPPQGKATALPPPPPLYVAPPTISSLWGPGFDMCSLFPTSRIPQHDRGLLVWAGVAGSIDMMTAYMARSLATLETW